jgi:hypothetical protein
MQPLYGLALLLLLLGVTERSNAASNLGVAILIVGALGEWL